MNQNQNQCGMSWSACTPVVRLDRPVTTNRSDACLIRINVLLSLPARRRGDISTPGRQNSPFFVLSLSLSSSPEKTAARNKGRRVSRNVRAAAGEVRSRRIPPHLRTYFFLSPACFPPSRSVTPPPPEGGGPERLVTCPKLSPRMVSPPRRTQNRLFPPPWFPHEHVTELHPIEDATQTDVSGGRKTRDTDA